LPKKAPRSDWPFYGGTQFAWRYSALDQINTANVKNVVLAWAFQTGDYEQGLQATPIVVDGVLYLSTTHSWFSRWTQRAEKCCGSTDTRCLAVRAATYRTAVLLWAPGGSS